MSTGMGVSFNISVPRIEYSRASCSTAPVHAWYSAISRSQLDTASTTRGKACCGRSTRLSVAR